MEWSGPTDGPAFLSLSRAFSISHYLYLLFFVHLLVRSWISVVCFARSNSAPVKLKQTTNELTSSHIYSALSLPHIFSTSLSRGVCLQKLHRPFMMTGLFISPQNA